MSPADHRVLLELSYHLAREALLASDGLWAQADEKVVATLLDRMGAAYRCATNWHPQRRTWERIPGTVLAQADAVARELVHDVRQRRRGSPAQ